MLTNAITDRCPGSPNQNVAGWLPWFDTRRQYLWLIIVVVGVGDLFWCAISGCSLEIYGWIIPTSAVAGLVLLSLFYTFIRVLPDWRVAKTLHDAALLIAYTAVAGTLSYLVASLNRPLIDPALASIDGWLGFDWLAWSRWVEIRPYLSIVLAVLYKSLLLQIVLVIVVLGLLRHNEAVCEKIMLFVATSLTIILLSGIFPAASAWVYYGFDFDKAYHLPHFEALRNSSLRLLSPLKIVGIVTFPSFHTAIAIILPYSVRFLPWLFWPLVLINTGVILSIPSEGGHYFIDIFTGGIITILAIAWIRRWFPVTDL